MVAALSESWTLDARPETASALSALIGFIDRHMADPRDGVWMESVEEDGRPLRPARAHGWKANYHDVRSMLKFVDAFRRPTR